MACLCAMLVFVFRCWLLCDVRCRLLLFLVRCLLSVVCRLSSRGSLFGVYRSLCVAGCVFLVASYFVGLLCCSLIVVCCLLCVVFSLSFAVCCLLVAVVYCMLLSVLCFVV